MYKLLSLLTATFSVFFFSCPRRTEPLDPGVLKATAELRGWNQEINGTINFAEIIMHGTHITGSIGGLEPNRLYAIHIHEGSSCENTDAPGGHFDPAESGIHGYPGLSPALSHAGDLPNIQTGPGGIAQLDYITNSIGLRDSPFSIIGRTIVLHANADDFTTQPDGAAGERIACGVITAVSETE